jgi:membrane protein YdbS with pleckstrin-like domain
MEILVFRDGEQLGPYSVEEVRQSVATGAFVSTDLAWHEGAADWMPLSSIPNLLPQQLQQPSRPASTSKPVSVASGGIGRKALGSYAQATLQSDEQVLYNTSISPLIIVGATLAILPVLLIWVPLTFGIATTFSSAAWLLLLVPLLIPLTAFINYKSSELVITDRRILIKVGFIQRRTLEMFISKVESVAVNQGLFGRIFDYGTVTIRGTGGSAEPFRTIPCPIEFRNCIQRVQSASESR